MIIYLNKGHYFKGGKMTGTRAQMLEYNRKRQKKKINTKIEKTEGVSEEEHHRRIKHLIECGVLKKEKITENDTNL